MDIGCFCNVIEKVFDMVGWGCKMFKGCGLGIVVYCSFLIYVVIVVEVEVFDVGDFSVIKLWVVIDVGIVVNIDMVKN